VEELPLEMREHLFKIIEINVMFLKDMNIIDYSLLLIFREWEGVGEKGEMIRLNQKYEMGLQIIDFLQVYN
jgi:hypothetical protein